MPKKYKLKNGETRWKFRAYLGINPKTGKQAFTNRQGFKTKTEANKELRRIKHKVDEGIYFEEAKRSKKYTYEEVYEMWLKEYKNTVTESTFMKVTGDFERRILPEIGNYLIDKITHDDMQTIANKWGKYIKCSAWIATSARIFKYAQRHSLTENNPTEFVTIPKPKKRKREKQFYEAEELRKFLNALADDPDIQKIILLRLLIFTGIRRGEALALYWECIDFEEKTIEIKRGVTRRNYKDKTKVYIREPKTDTSHRTVSVDNETLRLLQEWKQYQFNERVFNSRSGTILSTSKPRIWLRQVAKRAKIDPINVHGLRHTHTTLLIEAGAEPKEIQERLGHSNIKTTFNIYSHLTKRSKESFAEKFSNYIETEQFTEQKDTDDD